MNGSLIFLLILILNAIAFGQHQSPYSGMQHREIKALSPEEIDRYLKGEGMGLAMAAELNEYPGPKHVLELSEKLQLTQEQRRHTQTVFDKMKARAIEIGKEIVNRERELDQLFSNDKIDNALLQSHLQGIAQLQGQLRLCHLEAHLEMKRILTPLQIGSYSKLRGYQHDPSNHH